MRLTTLSVGTNRLTTYQAAFGTELRDGVLVVPPGLARVLSELDVRTGEQIVAYAQTYPRCVADLLGWTPAEVSEAARTLAVKLNYSCRSSPDRAFGALPEE